MCRSTTFAESSAARSPPPQLDGFFFALVGPGDLLALPLRSLVSRCDRFRRPGKSSGPPPFAPSLNVQGDDTHKNSGFFGDLTPSSAKQLPRVVRMAMGTTVFRIRIELIFRRRCNLITPSRSCRGLSVRCRGCRVSQGCGLVSADRPPRNSRKSWTLQREFLSI
jgi:hypothetical protein